MFKRKILKKKNARLKLKETSDFPPIIKDFQDYRNLIGCLNFNLRPTYNTSIKFQFSNTLFEFAKFSGLCLITLFQECRTFNGCLAALYSFFLLLFTN
jgi:hypothetical protein